MRPGDRLICAFIDQLPAGAEFKDWPLHVTVVPWFRIEASADKLAEDIKASLAGLSSFEVRMGRKATFGNHKTVNLVQQPSPFDDIEASVRMVLKRQDAWLADETTKQRRPYKPHVTAQKGTRMNEGDSFWCDRVYIIEQKGGHKTVAAEILL
jgi:2'-5' RNA ligase